MGKKKVIILTIAFAIAMFGALAIDNSRIFEDLKSNKTFFKDEYVGLMGQKIFIPKYSYFMGECCGIAATFWSLRSEGELREEIDNYMKDFEYFRDEHTYGYRKDGLVIQRYKVTNEGLYRIITITYSLA